MPKRILLIDDEKDFTELVGTLLRFHNLTVDTLNDPLDVEQTVKTTTYDLVVTDLMMPHLDGVQLIARLRKLPPYRTVPIIALSAKILAEEERKQLLQHQVHFLAKPFEPHGLVELITKLLS